MALSKQQIEQNNKLLDEIIKGHFYLSSDQITESIAVFFKDLFQQLNIDLTSLLQTYQKELLSGFIVELMDNFYDNSADEQEHQQKAKDLFFHLNKNHEIINDILHRVFPGIIGENKKSFARFMVNFLASQQIHLHYFSGSYTTFIIRKMKQMLDKQGRRFNEQKAKQIVATLPQEIEAKNQRERDLYCSQEKYPSILTQLKTQGYVEANHLLLNEDIQDMFRVHKQEFFRKGFFYTDALNIVDDQGAALKQALNNYKTQEGILFIPVNIGNHWILLIRQQVAGQVTMNCWDPLPPPSKKRQQQNEPLKIINNVLKGVYSNSKPVKAQYEYANEQHDGFTCGYRVVRKAFLVAKMTNSLTQAGSSNKNEICTHFVKLLAAKNPVLKKENLEVISDARSSLIYVKRKENSCSTIKQKQQFSEDEKLAIVLQDIYCENPDIDSNVAFEQAKKEVTKISPNDLFDKQRELEKKLSSISFAFFEQRKLRELKPEFSDYDKESGLFSYP